MPTIGVDVTPTSATLLDVFPYNVFTITCNVTQPEAVTVEKTIMWSWILPSGMMQNIDLNSNITNVRLENSTSTSELSVSTSSAGQWQFICTSNLKVPGDPVISSSATAEATVKG